MTGTERTGRTALPLAEAAGRLGLTPDALRMRIRRGKAEGFKRDGHVFVYLDDPPERTVRSSVRSEQAAREGRRTTEQPRRTGVPGDPESLAVVVEFQKVELDRLLRENERLNRRLDHQSEESRRMLEMLQREQVLRQQEQGLRQQIQGVVERLSDRLALPGSPAGGPTGHAARAGRTEGSPPAPEAPGTGPARPEAPEPARREPAAPGPRPEPEPRTPSRLDERMGEAASRRYRTGAPADRAPACRPDSDAPPPRDLPDAGRPTGPPASPAPDRRTEELGQLLKEIGQSLRDLENGDRPSGGPPARPRPAPAGHAAAAAPSSVAAEDRAALGDILNRVPLDEDRRKAARILRRLFRGRNEQGPADR